MATSSVNSTSSTTTLSATYLSLISKTMTAEKKPLTTLTAKRDEVKIKKAAYEDLKTQLDALIAKNSTLTAFGDTTATNLSTIAKVNGVADSSFTATATDLSAAGNYAVKVTQIAKPEIQASARFGSSDSALGKTGNLLINNQNIEIKSTDTLRDLVIKINNSDQDETKAVTAQIIDNRLVLTAKQSGTDHAAQVTDAANLFQFTTPQIAKNTQLTVNGIEMTRQGSNDLTDVIDGLTINLDSEAEGKNFTVSVVNDLNAKSQTISNFLTQFNQTQKYLRNKVSTTKNSDGTYSRGAFAGESSIRGLYQDLSALMGTNTGTGAIQGFADLGISFDEDMQLKITDSTKLQTALEKKSDAVASFIKNISDKMTATLSGYNGNSSYLTKAISSSEERLAAQENQIIKFNSRMTALENRLTKQYAAVQTNIETMTNQYSLQASILSALSGSSS